LRSFPLNHASTPTDPARRILRAGRIFPLWRDDGDLGRNNAIKARNDARSSLGSQSAWARSTRVSGTMDWHPVVDFRSGTVSCRSRLVQASTLGMASWGGRDRRQPYRQSYSFHSGRLVEKYCWRGNRGSATDLHYTATPAYLFRIMNVREKFPVPEVRLSRSSHPRTCCPSLLFLSARTNL
jgi:hypothetical protein